MYISKLLGDAEMCTYPIFFFTTDATTETSDIKESIDSTESKKKSNKRTFLYHLTSWKCRYNIIEPDDVRFVISFSFFHQWQQVCLIFEYEFDIENTSLAWFNNVVSTFQRC